jgi:hypothetical protein
MALTFSVGGSGGDFKRAPSGSHIAVCNMVADCGLQPGSAQYPQPKRKVYLRFEIPAERIEYEKDGKKLEGPLTIGKFYTASMNEKATLRKHLEGWRGKAFTDQEAEVFDVGKLLGVACMLSVVEEDRDGKTYSNIAGIGKLPKGLPPPVAEGDLLYFDDDSSQAEFDALPPWLREKIEKQIRKPVTGSDFRDDELDDVDAFR